jgi:Na+/H+ antiporter NhaD/arsenite permease-like protein
MALAAAAAAARPRPRGALRRRRRRRRHAGRLAQVWRLVTILCVLTAVLSSVLDNVTTILLVAPVTMRLCEVLNINPTPVLLAEVIFSNIGGTATGVGDPPNVIIVSNETIKRAGITFGTFLVHMLLGCTIVGVICYFFLRYVHYRLAARAHAARRGRSAPALRWSRTALTRRRRRSR